MKLAITFTPYFEDKESYDYIIRLDENRFRCNGDIDWANLAATCGDIIDAFYPFGGRNKNRVDLIVPDHFNMKRIGVWWFSHFAYGPFRIYTVTTKRVAENSVQVNTFNTTEYTEMVDVLDEQKLYIPSRFLEYKTYEEAKEMVYGGKSLSI